MNSASASAAPPPAYSAARERLAHRFRAIAVVDVTGDDRTAFLQGQLSQEMRGLSRGETRPAAGLTPKGKLLFVARAVGGEDRVRLLLPASAGALVLEHLRRYGVFSKVGIEDRSADFLRLGLYGPDAPRLVFPPEMDRLPGEGEFSAELLAPAARRAGLEGLLESAGSRPVPEETAEVLRVEAGRPRFGADMDSSNLPDEVGMDAAISETKGCYVGQEVVARLRTYGRVNRRLVGFRFPAGPAAPGTTLQRAEGETPSRTEAGRVTSAVVSPAFGPIGLGYAFRDVPVGGRLVEAGSQLVAIVSALPFA